MNAHALGCRKNVTPEMPASTATTPPISIQTDLSAGAPVKKREMTRGGPGRTFKTPAPP